MSKSLEERVKAIIVDELGVEELDVTPGASFRTDLAADSLDCMELTIRFEEEFNIEIPDSAFDNLDTVQDAFDYLKSNVNFTERATR